MDVKKITCNECGRIFCLSENQIEWYLSKGWNLPKRCFTCREIKRNNKNNKTSTQRRTGKSDFGLYASMMQSGVIMKRNTRPHTDDFRGYLSYKTTIVF